MLRRPDDPAVIHAVLGPTNTGKTHRALERMLQHHTGMIGLPLRLLAREVYERLTTRVGEEAVALVTGEERRIPRRPRYWVATVEAMPEVGVEFLAVDEVQLAADRARGHVYTDRLLHARGTAETWFMGSEAVAPLLGRLVPASRLDPAPRLSRLSFVGHSTLRALPPRSAVVAFRAERVYALAERLRARSGGAAVVMGALSPRARNLQVALFQSGEVNTLVATDAIGMGLNLDVDHVAFADLEKFDGQRIRGLAPLELGQIAGRAGRWTRDGTFGTVDTCPPLPADLAARVEAHRYPVLTRLRWRSRDLDLHDLAGLRRSLSAPPPLPFLERARDDDDEAALAALAERPSVRERATSPARVALLWDVCRVPDYRKLLVDAHPDLLERVYVRLVDHGRLSASWVLRQVDDLDRADGDLDALTTRLAFVRTWAYLAWRDGWMEDAPGVRGRVAEVEERLSDALHAALVERFVDRRARALAGGRPVELEAGEVRVGGLVVGRLEGLGFTADGPINAAVRQQVEAELEARVAALVDAPHEAFGVDVGGTLRWRGAPVGRLVAGPDVREPGVRLLRQDALGPAAVTRVARRLTAWARDHVARLLAPLRRDDVPRGPARGLLYAMEPRLGVVPAAEVGDLVAGLDPRARRALAAAGVRFGAEWVYSLPLLDAAEARLGLLAVARGIEPPAVPSGPHAPRPPVELDWPTVGYAPVGPTLFRLDAYEAAGARLRALRRGGPFALPADLDLGPQAGAVLRAAGYVEDGGRWARRRPSAPGARTRAG